MKRLHAGTFRVIDLPRDVLLSLSWMPYPRDADEPRQGISLTVGRRGFYVAWTERRAVAGA